MKFVDISFADKALLYILVIAKSPSIRFPEETTSSHLRINLISPPEARVAVTLKVPPDAFPFTYCLMVEPS